MAGEIDRLAVSDDFLKDIQKIEGQVVGETCLYLFDPEAPCADAKTHQDIPCGTCYGIAGYTIHHLRTTLGAAHDFTHSDQYAKHTILAGGEIDKLKDNQRVEIDIRNGFWSARCGLGD